MRGQSEPRRPGFTLIELLVVIGIITFLSGLAYFAGGALLRSEQAQRAGAATQSTLQIAKQMALRDRVLYGVRLVPDDTGNFNGLEYIYQPPDYVSNRYQVDQSNPNQIIFERDISDGLPDRALWPIRVGDFIQTENGLSPRLITRMLSNTRIQTLSANSPILNHMSSNMRVMRSPRPVPGETIIQLPDGIIIDRARSRIVPDQVWDNSTNPATQLRNNYDIVFAPASGVTGPGGSTGKIILWIREAASNPATSTNQVLIVVFTKTGRIASYEVNLAAGEDPYSNTYDPRPSGL